VGTSNTVFRAANFTASIGINTHLSYTDGAYANVANVKADLAYLGISLIRDGTPNPKGGIPYFNQVAALKTLAAASVRFDFIVEPSSTSIANAEQQIQSFDAATPGAVFAVEGPNEINNFPVTYNGLTGQAAATAFQSDLYSAIAGSPATSGISVYNFTGGIVAPILAGGAITRNGDGSYTLTNGQVGFRVTLPTGVSTITMTYTGTGKAAPASGLFGYPAQNQQGSIAAGKNGSITYTYNNISGAPKTLYADFIDYGATYTLTSLKVTGPGSNANLATFDPKLSLAGQADAANMHIYPGNGGAIGPVIAHAYQVGFNTAPGPRVITETGYTTDPAVSNGVTQTVQAQQIINGLLEAYQSGVQTTYLYELLDEKADPNNKLSQMHYGLFNNDNTPKLAAVAVHNLTSLLADTGANAASFTTTRLADTLTGGNAGDQSMQFEKSNGGYDIALWNDNFAGTANTDQVTLALGGTFASVNVYDVITGAETSLTNVSQITAALGADPLLVEITPASLNISAALNILTPAVSVSASATVSFWAPSLSLSAPLAPPLAAVTPQPVSGLLASLITTQPHAASGFLTSQAIHHA
jgi:hypothetical protein